MKREQLFGRRHRSCDRRVASFGKPSKGADLTRAASGLLFDNDCNKTGRNTQKIENMNQSMDHFSFIIHLNKVVPLATLAHAQYDLMNCILSLKKARFLLKGNTRWKSTAGPAWEMLSVAHGILAR